MADRNLVLQLLITAKDQASAALQSVKTGLSAIGEATSRALEPLRTFGGLLTTALGIGGAKELQDRADAYTRLTNSLKIATTGEAEYQAALKAVAEIASRTNADINTTAKLYGKVAQSAKELGLSQQQVGQLTEVISKGMQLSGASAESASGAILQLTQAFGSGALRGEEFNSVMEASPELMRQLAAGLGVTIGELRGLAEQGALTSRAVSAALLSQKDAIDEAYGKTTRTVAEAFTNLNNQLILYVGKLNESTGATAAIGGTLRLLADNLNIVAAAVGAGLVTALAKGAASMGIYVKESLAAAQASRDAAIAAKAQQAAAIQTAQGNLAAAQAAVNRAIAEQRMATILVEEAMGEQALASARATASAAAQAATAATTRYMAAQQALNAAQATTATGAGLLARSMGFLAGPGGLILLAVSAFAALIPLLSKSKANLDDLTTSTDQYKTSLKGLNEAQLLANMGRLNEGIRKQKEIVEEAETKVNKLREGHRGLFEVLSDGRPVMVQLTEAEGNLADARQKLAQMQENLTVTTQALRVARQQESADLGKQLAQYTQIQTAMAQYAQELDRLSKQQGVVSKANQERIQSELELARASGDLHAVEKLTLALAQAKATAARQQAELDRAAAAAAQINLDAVQRGYDLLSAKQPKDEESLRLARQDVEAKNAQAAASSAVATYLEDQANRTGQLNTAQLGQLSAQERLLQAQSNEAQAAAELARSKGDEYEARQQLVRVAEIEAQLAQLNAEKKAIEAQAAIAVLKSIQDEVNSKLALGEIISDTDRARLVAATNAMNTAAIEAEAAGLVAEAEAKKYAAVQLSGLQQQQNTQRTQENTQSIKENAQQLSEDQQAQQDYAEALKISNTMLAGAQSYYQASRDAMEKLSIAAREYYDLQFSIALSNQGVAGSYEIAMKQQQAWNTALDEGSITLGEYQEQLRLSWASLAQGEQKMLFSMNIFQQWEAAVDIATGKTKALFYEQASQVELLRQRLDEMAESGSYDLSVIKNATRAVNGEFSLLDEQDLAGLQESLDQVNNKLAETQEATKSARERLAELNAELLEAKGEDKKAEILRQQISYMSDLKEINDQMDEAQATHNRDLIDILMKQREALEEINRVKLANIDADAKAKAAGSSSSSSSSSSTSSTGSSSSSSSSSSGGKTYTLNLTLGSSKLTTTTATDPSSFLDDLETSRRRSA